MIISAVPVNSDRSLEPAMRALFRRKSRKLSQKFSADRFGSYLFGITYGAL